MRAKAKYYVDTAFNGHLRPDVSGDTLAQAIDWCRGSFGASRIRYRGRIIAKWVNGKRVKMQGKGQ